MKQITRTVLLDDSIKLLSSTCRHCKNVISLADHKCAVFGTCPINVWNDKESCPHRKLEEAPKNA